MYARSVNLSGWARRQGVSCQTAWRWVKKGTMPVHRQVIRVVEGANRLGLAVAEVLMSMCARLHGQRAAKNRAARAVRVATGEAVE